MDLTQRKKQLQDLRQEMALRVARTHKHLFRKDTAVSANFSERQLSLLMKTSSRRSMRRGDESWI